MCVVVLKGGGSWQEEEWWVWVGLHVDSLHSGLITANSIGLAGTQ